MIWKSDTRTGKQLADAGILGPLMSKLNSADQTNLEQKQVQSHMYQPQPQDRLDQPAYSYNAILPSCSKERVREAVVSQRWSNSAC
ncbi:hypothetical protein B2K_39500 [Paenibacillus mucilaginosus K02]|uniref:Uncharacterized protein n=1 Tax=Paenibacillus mucilaginosus K02 TaxID=997761 RepID=R9UN69_9BACL|nr:hypothetical protein B2K_39500 [Paenibacillus mucilaginosus K02]